MPVLAEIHRGHATGRDLAEQLVAMVGVRTREPERDRIRWAGGRDHPTRSYAKGMGAW